MNKTTADEIQTIRQEFLSISLHSFIDCAAHFNNQSTTLIEFIDDQSEKIALFRSRFSEETALTTTEKSIWIQLVKQSDQAVIA